MQKIISTITKYLLPNNNIDYSYQLIKKGKRTQIINILIKEKKTLEDAFFKKITILHCKLEMDNTYYHLRQKKKIPTTIKFFTIRERKIEKKN